MVNRVLLNSSGLKVSKPGNNVISAPIGQLSFSSDWNAMSLLQSADYTVNSWSGSADRGQHNGTINLSKSFPSPPLVAFYIFSSDGALVPVGFGSGCFFGWRRQNGGTTNSVLCVLQVNNSNIQVTAMFDKTQTPSLSTPSFSFRYFVFDYNT